MKNTGCISQMFSILSLSFFSGQNVDVAGCSEILSWC